MNFKQIILFFFISVLFFSCEKDVADDSENNQDFNRSELLLNWSDNIIIPGYDDFYSSLIDLEESINMFTETPSVDLLATLSEFWLDSYKIWQHIEMFDIGLAEVINYKGKMNIYPTDSELILQNIESGDYDLNNNNNFDARGFPALDYMIHGLAENANEIVDFYISYPSYSDYLSNLISAMIYNTNLIIQDWSVYRDDFLNSTDNTATSSVNKMTNDFIFYFEKGLRANKIGIPAGIFSTDPLPTTVEAYYKQDVSKDLALEALLATKNFFSGKHYNNNLYGNGLSTYLDFISISSDNNLSELILSQYDEAEIELAQVNDNFVYQIETNNNQMLYAYDAIQVLVVSFKVDMLQALAISVDYVDADGD
jgi:hypothetical protein